MNNLFMYMKIYNIVRKLDNRMKTEGFESIYRQYLTKSVSLPPMRDVTPVEAAFISKIGPIIDKVCFNFLGKARCLHRSLVGFELFNDRGIPIDLVVGVTKAPFMAHAWLEYKGNVVNDAPETNKHFFVQFHTGKYRSGKEAVVT